MSDWDGIERRHMPHPYEMLQQIDARFIQLRDDLSRISIRLEEYERKLRGIEDSMQQAVGMARLLRWAVVFGASGWGFALWARTHLQW